MDADQPDRPAMRVVHGDPTDIEIAAVIAVLTSRGGSREVRAVVPRSAWADPARAVRRPFAARPDGWRGSARPS